jgi:hypothetical protein
MDSKAKEFNELLDTLQDTIRALNRRGYKLYDTDNNDCFLTGEVGWDKEGMKLLMEYEREE